MRCQARPGPARPRDAPRSLCLKIIDVICKRVREVHIEPLNEQSMDDAKNALFAKDGRWLRCLKVSECSL